MYSTIDGSHKTLALRLQMDLKSFAGVSEIPAYSTSVGAMTGPSQSETTKISLTLYTLKYRETGVVESRSKSTVKMFPTFSLFHMTMVITFLHIFFQY